MTEQEENKKLRLENAELLRVHTKDKAQIEKLLKLITELHQVTGEILDKEIDG